MNHAKDCEPEMLVCPAAPPAEIGGLHRERVRAIIEPPPFGLENRVTDCRQKRQALVFPCCSGPAENPAATQDT